jgi:glutaredoxin
MRCEKHDLSAGPDGKCAICHREERAGGSTTTRVVWGIVAALCAPLCIAIAGHFAGLWRLYGASEPVSVAPERAPAAASAPSDVSTDAPVPDAFEVRVESDPPPSTYEDTSAVGAASPGPAASGAATADSGPEVAPISTQAQGPGELTRAELERAFSEVKIVVYVTDWCPRCREARAWLEHNRIRHVEYNVDNDTQARARQLKLNPDGSIPTFDIDGQVLIGFGEDYIGNALRKAAEKRARRL